MFYEKFEEIVSYLVEVENVRDIKNKNRVGGEITELLETMYIDSAWKWAFENESPAVEEEKVAIA